MTLTPLSGSTVPAESNLDALVPDVWARILAALAGRWPPFALPTFATTGPAGARARVLALRGAQEKTRTFVFHTDARSDKIGEITADPRVSLVFWDPADGIEARFDGVARTHCNDALALAAWAKVSPLRHMASRTLDPPGAPLAATRRFDELVMRDDAPGSVNFAVIEVRVARLDWLWVGAEDMRRASFDWDGTKWQGRWVIP